ncbi:MAG: methyltransferase, FkbM subfamily protein [Candidatus Peregrinibacteria bacterium Greene0416_19]|nr:MAG: methyltransferase, FkbM subfamily protein [Candidatus Peregrinibacteria bacterium Greene0416_19]
MSIQAGDYPSDKGYLERARRHCYRPSMSSPLLIRKRRARFFVDADAGYALPNHATDWYVRWWTESYKEWEPETFRVFDAFLDRHHSYIDVGAWIGPTVLYGASKAKHVYALEPDPVAYAALHRNIVMNPQFARKITAVEAALGDSDGESIFGGNGELGNSESTLLIRDPSYISDQAERPRMGSAEQDRAWRDGARTTVRTVTIETFLRENRIADCSFVKMDIEGGEAIAVPAMEKFLRAERPTFFVSLHWVYLSKPQIESIVNLLYDIYPFIYDVHLHRTLQRETVMGKCVGQLVCAARPLPPLRRAAIAVAHKAMNARAYARGLLRRM